MFFAAPCEFDHELVDVAVAGVCGLLLYLGLWPVIRRFIALATGWTSLIPTGVVASAKLDSEALSLPTVDPVQREAVAVRRRRAVPATVARRNAGGTGPDTVAKVARERCARPVSLLCRPRGRSGHR